MAHSLRKHCLPILPIAVRTTRRPGSEYGWCTLYMKNKSRFRIVLRLNVDTDRGRTRHVTSGELVDAMRHEWAHALAVSALCPDHHGPEWGVAYSKVYLATSGDGK